MSTPLLIAALKDEVRELKAKMAIDCVVHFKPATLYRGLVFNREVDLLITGMGVERMRKGLEAALLQRLPSSILYVGYAGGCSPIASLGSLVLSQTVLHEKQGKRFAGSPEFLEKGKKICEEKKWNYHVGAMVTVDRVVSSPHEKADLGAVHDAIALDMEAAAVAQIASEKNIPWLVVKSILDPVEMQIPDLQDCIWPTGEPRPMHLVEHLFHKPNDLMQLPKIQYCASQARQSLARFIEAWVQGV